MGLLFFFNCVSVCVWGYCCFYLCVCLCVYGAVVVFTCVCVCVCMGLLLFLPVCVCVCVGLLLFLPVCVSVCVYGVIVVFTCVCVCVCGVVVVFTCVCVCVCGVVVVFTYQGRPVYRSSLVLGVKPFAPDQRLLHAEHLEHGVNPDPIALLPVTAVKLHQDLKEQQSRSLKGWVGECKKRQGTQKDKTTL